MCSKRLAPFALYLLARECVALSGSCFVKNFVKRWHG
jgi:hypothetical protein